MAQKKKQEPKRAENDLWLFNAEGAKLIRKGDLIPAGFVDSPAKVK